MNKNNKKAYFKEEWLGKDNFPEFLPWLVKGKVSTQAKCKLSTQAKCKLCQKTIELNLIWGFKLFAKSPKWQKTYSSFRQQLTLFQIFNNSSTVNPNNPSTVNPINSSTVNPSECPDDSANIKVKCTIIRKGLC